MDPLEILDPLALGLAALTVLLLVARSLVFSRARVDLARFHARLRAALVDDRSVREAIRLCEEQGGPLARAVRAGLLKYGLPAATVAAAVDDAGTHERRVLARRLPLLLLSSLAALAAGAAAWLAAGGGALARVPAAPTAVVAGALGLVGWALLRGSLARFERNLATARDALLGAIGESDAASGRAPGGSGDAGYTPPRR